MASSLRHGEWYLISEQKFRARAALGRSAQIFRGHPYLVLSDKITGQHLRLNIRAARVWDMFDGKTTAQQIWEKAGVTQSEVFEWVMTLVSAGMLLSDHEMDPKHLTDRGIRKRNQMLEAKAAGPLSIKLPLFDPSRLIARLFPILGPLFTPWGGALIAGLIAAALVMTMLQWQDLTGAIDRGFLSQQGLIGLALAYPILKALHELAHGLMVHKFGGEVREFGVMFLVFFPVPYVEASDANAFPSKYARMLVAAAGVLAELSVAALSLFAWSYMEPGIERAVLFNFMLIGSISTLVFNGNPLLKFDSYFVLADWLEIPNLATKAGAYVQDLFLSAVLGLRREVHPSGGEGPVLLIYGVLSLIYRLVLALSICLIVSQLFFILGIILAVWSLVMSFGLPIRNLIKKAYQMARGQNRGPAAFWRGLVAFLVVFGLVGVVKLPFVARGEGVVTILPSAEVRAGTSGELRAILEENGATVVAGAPVLTVENPSQTARLQVLQIAERDLVQRLQNGGLGVMARQAAERELALIQSDLFEAQGLEAALTVTSPNSGRLEWTGGRAPLVGGFVFRGDRLGEIVAPGAVEVVMSFPAAYAGLLPQTGAKARLVLADGRLIDVPIDQARVIDQGGQVPAGLLVSGGGTVADMPGSAGLALDSALVVWLHPDIGTQINARVTGRISLPKATLWQQTLFHLRRIFLRATRV